MCLCSKGCVKWSLPCQPWLWPQLGPVLCFPVQGRHGQTGTSPAKMHKDGKAWSSSHIRRLGKLGLVSLDNTHGRISPMCINNLMKGGKKTEASPFERRLVKVHEATSTNSMQEILKYTDILVFKKNVFHSKSNWRWNRLPREAVESPSLEMFKTWLNTVLSTLL